MKTENGKNILIGVCGSIAAYKSAEIIRGFVKKGWTVKVIMTSNAGRFITPLTFATLSKNPVYSDLFSKQAYESPEKNHIALSEFADVILIAPATAHMIGKIASGICDDLLTCTIFASKAKIVFAPAMDENMWNHKIVKSNVDKLKACGYFFVGPEEGELASGKKGTGRLIDVGKIIAAVEKYVE